MIQVSLKRVVGDYGFEARDAQGHTIATDSSSELGGHNSGVRPMQLLLMALGSCSAIDVVTVLKKQRQPLEDVQITIRGEREQDTIPSLWKNIQVAFTLTGPVDPAKANKACDLSINRYCSVAETLRRAGAAITWQVTIVPSVTLEPQTQEYS